MTCKHFTLGVVEGKKVKSIYKDNVPVFPLPCEKCNKAADQVKKGD